MSGYCKFCTVDFYQLGGLNLRQYICGTISAVIKFNQVLCVGDRKAAGILTRTIMSVVNLCFLMPLCAEEKPSARILSVKQ